MSEKKGGSNKPDSGIRYAKEVSPIDGVEDDSLDDQNDMKVVMQTTPVRHSERTAGKKFKYKTCLLVFTQTLICLDDYGNSSWSVCPTTKRIWVNFIFFYFCFSISF